MKTIILAAGFLWISTAFVSISHAEESAQEQVQSLTVEQRLAILERKQEISLEEAAAKAKEATLPTSGKDGFTLKSADGHHRLKIAGYVQGDYRAFLGDRGAFNDQFLIRRARLIVDATVNKFVDIRLQQEFGGTSSTNHDAYVDLKYFPKAKFRVGKFAPPIGLERIQSSADLLLPELGLTSNLVPNRDAGAQLSGDVFNGALTYHVGVFNGNVDNTNAEPETNASKDAVARMFVHPFKTSAIFSLKEVGLGVSGSIGKQNGTATTSQLNGGFKTDGQNTFFQYRSGAFANGERTRVSPQGYWYPGRFGVFGDYVASTEDLQLSTTSTAVRSFTNTAWQINFSYVLTGENASFKGVKPKKAFDPANKTWGALELTGRAAKLSVDEDVFAGGFQNTANYAKSARAFTGGLNWYLNTNTKVSSAFTYTTFDGGAGGSTNNNQDKQAERVWITRLQATF